MAAGRTNDRLPAAFGRHGWSHSSVVRPAASTDRDRIRRVATLDDLLVAAARKASASQISADRRLAYRMSLPQATVMSSLALAALMSEQRAISSRLFGFVSELSNAGVLAAWFFDDRVIAVSRPDMTIVGGNLHSIGRPAARWPDEGIWFWHGIWIPEHLATRPDELGLADVLAERNMERRRVIIDRIGFERLARDASRGEPTQQDDYGRLWRLGPLVDEEEYVAVEVSNSTPESDGSFRRYFLRVPPGTKTAREGVAWTFDMSVREYTITSQS